MLLTRSRQGAMSSTRAAAGPDVPRRGSNIGIPVESTEPCGVTRERREPIGEIRRTDPPGIVPAVEHAIRRGQRGAVDRQARIRGSGLFHERHHLVEATLRLTDREQLTRVQVEGVWLAAGQSDVQGRCGDVFGPLEVAVDIGV